MVETLSDSAQQTRQRIIEAAAALLTEGGREAVSTRAVSTRANVQAPAIYRIFGDKQGLLDAVASHGFATYLRSKAELIETPDPVDDLRQGWDLHVEFGVSHPAFYTLIYGDPRPGVEPPAAREAAAMLAKRVRRIAEAGRLRISEEKATHLIKAAGTGTTLKLIGLSEEERDPTLSTLARESVIAAVTTDAASAPGREGGQHAVHAIALRAALPRVTALTPAERALLEDWLDRIAAG